jgi:hypothetical protein
MPCLTGMPAPSASMFCSGSFCYQYISTTGSRNNSHVSCVAKGGNLATYDSYAEQQSVEAGLKAAGTTLADYWLGYEHVGAC